MLGERADFRETRRVIAIVFFITAHSSTLEWTLSLSSLRPNNGAHSVVSFRSKWEIQINTNHDEFALVYQVRKWRLCLCRSFPRTLKYSPHWGEITSFAARVKGTWMYRDSKADDRRDRVHMDPKSISQHPALCALVPAGGEHYPKASLPVLLIGFFVFFLLCLGSIVHGSSYSCSFSMQTEQVWFCYSEGDYISGVLTFWLQVNWHKLWL